MIIHIQGAEIDRHSGVCSDWTLSLPGSYPPGQFADEVLHDAAFSHCFYFTLYLSAVLFNSVHPYASPVWSFPLHGSGLTEWYPGKLCVVCPHFTPIVL